ncbi:polymorphic toxin-type HINT domain-containing protein [Allonocardiopsis opalescens]|uniref:Pretoxin HINT domain-containing protein n=1 Tax=Allonocardiopsis opalescens TaxID=1144618 RepID=A0A2T0QD92_9ACTN|nr:polymorphic toxin-type HINT domain-containing protein [Allonocardiopsis opalescens]PRY01840.1 pretoxin HINT domain-containing protein [Allonocardiopsis opalescens]
MAASLPRGLRLARVLLFVFAGLTFLMSFGALLADFSGETLGYLLWVMLPGVLALVFGLRLAAGGRTLFWLIIGWSAWQLLTALSTLDEGEGQAVTQLLLPGLVLVLVLLRRSRAHLSGRARPVRRRPGLLQRLHDPQRGASVIEYAAVIVLAGALIVGLAAAFPVVQPQVTEAVDQLFNGGEEGGDLANAPDGGQDSDDPGGDGEGDGDGGDGDGGDDGGGDDGGNWFTDGLDQVGGFFGGLGGAIADEAVGLWETGEQIITDPGGFVEDTVGGIVDLGEALWNDPVGTLTTMVWDEESAEAWANGDYGEAIGRTVWNVGSWFIPGTQATKIPRVLNNLPDGNNRNDSDSDQDDDQDQDQEEEPDDSLACPLPNSFLPGTPVLLADGTHAPIEDIAVGDLVWAADPLTGQEGARQVTDLITGTGEKDLVTVTVQTDDGADTLTATAGHPFWLPGAAEWTDAADLRPGARLQTSSGTWAQITAVDHWTADRTVHNLTVADLHTYHVGTGADALLVHNTNADGDDCYRPPAPGTPEYEQRIQELMEDPAGGDTRRTPRVEAAARREAEVALAAENQGVAPGPLERAELDNSDPAFQRDQGDFVDANGQPWDVKGPRDLFPTDAPRVGGQPMPPNQRGRYDRETFMNEVNDELANGENVMIDPRGLSPEARQDVEELLSENPDWEGRVVIVDV